MLWILLFRFWCRGGATFIDYRVLGVHTFAIPSCDDGGCKDGSLYVTQAGSRVGLAYIFKEGDKPKTINKTCPLSSRASFSTAFV